MHIQDASLALQPDHIVDLRGNTPLLCWFKKVHQLGTLRMLHRYTLSQGPLFHALCPINLVS